MRRAAAVPLTAFVALTLLAGCARGDGGGGTGETTAETAPATTRPVPGSALPPPAGFPTGSFTRTISGAPAEHAPLEGRWTLVLAPDGTFELRGRFATRGRYTVSGARVTFAHDETCAEGVEGVYGWAAEGSTLRFEARDDPCGPTRRYHLTSGPWTREGAG